VERASDPVTAKNDGGAAPPSAPSPAEPVPPQIQSHGALLIFERDGFRLAAASETLPRLLARELHASLGSPVETVLERDLASRIRTLPPGTEERRIVSIRGRMLDQRIIADQDGVLVEIEPIDEHADSTVLGTALDEAAEALGRTRTLTDLARASCATLAEISGFAVVAFARLIGTDQLQILAETNDGTVSSLAGRSDTAKLLECIGGAEQLAFIADTAASPSRIVFAPGLHIGASTLASAELAAPSARALALVRGLGIASLGILPIHCDGELWGCFLLQSGYARRFGHYRRRFGRALAQITGTAVKRVLESVVERTEQICADALATFETSIADGSSALDALLFGEQILAEAAGAEGVAVLCGTECAVIGHAPDPDALLLRLPRLLAGKDDHIATDRVLEIADFSASELAGNTSMVAMRLAKRPFIALAAFRSRPESPADAAAATWEPARIEAFLGLARAFRRTLLLSDAAAAAELSSLLEEFDERAFGSGILRSAIMSSSATGMALLLGRGGTRLEILEFNPMFRRLFGLDKREPLAGTLEDIALRLGLPAALLFDVGQPPAEIELWTSELGPRVVEVGTRSIVRTRVGRAVRELTLIQVSDITRIRRQEVAMRIARDQALALIRARDELLANMSHELRTPLNAVIGFADMIAQQTFGPVGNERYVGYGRDIETAGRHLLELINDVLDLSRIASGRQLVEDAPVDLIELLKSCVSWAQAASRRRQVEFTADTGIAKLLVRCDERAVRQVLINLISNAIKFTPDDGGVRVELRWRMHGNIEIEVVDNGIGMTPHELARAFDPFFRGGGAYRRRIEGAGLGLSIARGLLELHGGMLTLASVEGRGTTARVELPGWRVVPADA
jgi:signal transduction histidine kinase